MMEQLEEPMVHCSWKRGDGFSLQDHYPKEEENPFLHGKKAGRQLASFDHIFTDFLYHTKRRKWVWFVMALEVVWYGFLFVASFTTFRTVCPASVNSMFSAFGFLFCQVNVKTFKVRTPQFKSYISSILLPPG